MFHDALKSLRKKLQKEAEKPKEKEPVPPSHIPAPAPAPQDEEPVDILNFVDKHGIVDKDREVPKEAVPARLKNPVIKKAPKRVEPEPDLTVFEEPEHDPAAGAEEILSYIDKHGIELKSSDLNSSRRSGEENLVRSKRSVEKQIDLHGLHAREAELRIRAVFADAKKRGYQQILIVHGRGNHSAGGDPILKRMVVDLLEGPLESQVASFFFAPLNEGGGGATRVILR